MKISFYHFLIKIYIHFDFYLLVFELFKDEISFYNREFFN